MAVDWVLGADVGGTKIKYTLGANSDSRDLQGEVDTDPTDPVGSISRLVTEIRRRRPDSVDRLAAVGMACAGNVPQRTSRLGGSPNLAGWENLALADLISDASDVKIFMLQYSPSLSGTTSTEEGVVLDPDA